MKATWLKELPKLWYRAKAVHNAIILLVTGVTMVVADKVVSFDEIEYVVGLIGGLLAVLGVERTENGPVPPDEVPPAVHVADVESQHGRTPRNPPRFA